MAGYGGMGRSSYQHDRVAPPKGLVDVPRFLKELLGGFFSRFFYIVKLVWSTGWWVLLTLSFVALFRGVSPIIGALISKNILNGLQGVLQTGALTESAFWQSDIFYLLIFLFVYRLAVAVINNVSSAVNRIAGEKVVRQVRTQIMEKALTLDLGSFDDPNLYEKMENANQEAGSRPLQIITQTFSIISSVIELISYLVVLLAVPGLWWVTLIIIAVSIPSAVINFIYRRKNFVYMRHRSKERRKMNYYASTLVDKDRIKEVRLFDLGETFIGRFQDAFREYYQGLRNLILAENGWHIIISLISCCTNLVFYILIAMMVFTGKILIGDYTLYTGAIASVAAAISTIITTSALVYEGTLFIDNLIVFMKEKQTIIPSIPNPKPVSRGIGHTIEFQNVSFRYPGTQRDVLKNVNLTIHPGDTIVIVGLNGAGKTTLIKLLTRLYDPTAGRILLDGRDIREYEVKSLYEMFGIIFQDYGMYADTVAENIRYGDIHKEIIRENIYEAARQSAAEEFINALPNGYDTPLMRIFEPEGRELSIGQWQKLAIARAFYGESDILILDEPTASLDPLAEQEIFRQFDLLRADKTTIFVSHRLSSATVADQVLVLEDGCIIESGTHAQLMAQEGKYHKLFTTQAERYLTKDAPGEQPGFSADEKRPPRPRRPFPTDGERPPRPRHPFPRPEETEE